MARDWELRWKAQSRDAPARADKIQTSRTFKGGHLRLYKNLAKAEGAALCQARTEKIGLRAFLFKRKVPGVVTPTCQCGRGAQTAAHLFYECADSRSQPLRALGYTSAEGIGRGLSHPDTAPVLARALVQSGWLPQFRVFNQLRQQDEEEAHQEHAWSRRPPPLAGPGRRRAPAP